MGDNNVKLSELQTSLYWTHPVGFRLWWRLIHLVVSVNLFCTNSRIYYDILVKLCHMSIFLVSNVLICRNFFSVVSCFFIFIFYYVVFVFCVIMFVLCFLRVCFLLNSCILFPTSFLLLLCFFHVCCLLLSCLCLASCIFVLLPTCLCLASVMFVSRFLHVCVLLPSCSCVASFIFVASIPSCLLSSRSNLDIVSKQSEVALKKRLVLEGSG